MGFIHALRRIARHLPLRRQTLMFSATMPKLMDEIAAAYLRDPVRIEAAPPGRPAERIDQAVQFVNQGDKAKLLETCLLGHPEEAALVFLRTKHSAEKLMKLLVSWGFSAGSIHGNKSQSQRERTLAAFREGSLKVLVATDVAARGLDIPLVRHVYNYDLPNVPENYIHRIGRTARAGAAGKAIAFCAPAEMGELAAVEKALGAQLPVIGGTRPVGAPPPPKPASGRPGPKPGPRPAPKPAPKPAAKPAPRPGGAPAAARPAGKPQGAGRGEPRRPGPRAPA